MNTVLGSIWFGKVGIVVMNNGFEDKAYITDVSRDLESMGFDQAQDEKTICETGLPFPVKQAKELI